MYNIDLTRDEAIAVLSALAAVTPSGGGGSLNSLGMRLAERTGLNPDLSVTFSMQLTARHELDQGEGW